MRYLLALDQGTTSSRALLFDERAALLGMAQEEHPRSILSPAGSSTIRSFSGRPKCGPHVGGCSPRTASAGARSARSGSATSGRRPSSGSGTAGGRSRTPSSGRTAAPRPLQAPAGIEPLVRGKTGFLLDPYFSATKLAWVLAHVPGAHRRAERGELCVGTVDSYLLFRPRAGRCTQPMSRTPPGRSSSTFIPSPGTRTSCASSTSH